MDSRGFASRIWAKMVFPSLSFKPCITTGKANGSSNGPSERPTTPLWEYSFQLIKNPQPTLGYASFFHMSPSEDFRLNADLLAADFRIALSDAVTRAVTRTEALHPNRAKRGVEPRTRRLPRRRLTPSCTSSRFCCASLDFVVRILIFTVRTLACCEHCSALRSAHSRLSCAFPPSVVRTLALVGAGLARPGRCVLARCAPIPSRAKQTDSNEDFNVRRTKAGQRSGLRSRWKELRIDMG